MALPATVHGASPVLYFSDIDWGPKTGWEGSSTRGAAVTVWGQNLGTTRGSSYITVNGAVLSADSDYAEWGIAERARGLSRITFWVNSSAQDGAGTIRVTVSGQTSNTLPFTVMNAVIYFISPAGSNSNNGLRSAPSGNGAGPFHDLFMFNPGLDYAHSAGNRNPSGDGQYIAYVRAGTYNSIDTDDAIIALRGPYGGPSKRKALIAYPGEAPVVDVANASRGLVWPASYSPYGRLDYFTYAKLTVDNGTWAYGLWGDYNRVVGNYMKDLLVDSWTGVVMVDNSQYAAIYGNLFEHCGFDSYKHNIYIKTHQDYVAGDKSVDHTDVGWNEFSNATAGADARGGVIFISRESGTPGKYTGDTRIHDNYFHDGNMDFIYIGDSTPIGDVTAYNNIFRGGTSINGGITMYDGTTNAYLYNNTFYQIGPTSQPMIWATGSTNAVFKNNIWQAQTGQPFFNLESYQGAKFSSERDLYYSPSGLNPPSGTNISLARPVTGNPQLVGPASNNFSLQASSPAIDAGTLAVASVVASDFNGVVRPQGPAFDVGAVEFANGSSTPSVQVSVAPLSVALSGGGSQQFTATVTGTSNTAVTWSLSAGIGTISGTGLYRAPATVSSQQTVNVIAMSVADPSRSARAAVTLNPAPSSITVSVSPTSASLNAGQTRQFTATVTGTTNTAVTWSLSAAIGAVSATGLYTAPATVTTQQTVDVIATSTADSSRSARATITLNPAASAITVTVSPKAVILNAGKTRQFAATVTGTSNTAVRWSLSTPVGTISASGLYTAPATVTSPQTVQVIATSVADASRSASAAVVLIRLGSPRTDSTSTGSASAQRK